MRTHIQLRGWKDAQAILFKDRTEGHRHEVRREK